LRIKKSLSINSNGEEEEWKEEKEEREMEGRQRERRLTRKTGFEEPTLHPNYSTNKNKTYTQSHPRTIAKTKPQSIHTHATRDNNGLFVLNKVRSISCFCLGTNLMIADFVLLIDYTHALSHTEADRKRPPERKENGPGFCTSSSHATKHNMVT
jgi:hypothetical protein